MTEAEVLDALECFMAGVVEKSKPTAWGDPKFLQQALIYAKLVEQWIRLKRGRGK